MPISTEFSCNSYYIQRCSLYATTLRAYTENGKWKCWLCAWSVGESETRNGNLCLKWTNLNKRQVEYRFKINEANTWQSFEQYKLTQSLEHTHRARGRGTLNFQASLCGGVYAEWKPQNSKQFNTRYTLHSSWSLYCTTMMMLANVAQPPENCEEKWINLLVELIVSGLEWGRSDAFVASICSSFFPKAALLPSHRCYRYGAE